jgi:hypothetical protein
MTLVPTYTFAGGEISEKLWGRVDLQKYQTGVAYAKNVHVGVEGGLFKRVGQYFVDYPKFQDSYAKMVPWRIADDDSYVLVFGEEYIRFIRLGGFVLWDPLHSPDPDSDAIEVDDYLEVPTTYTADEVRELKFTFANDIAYIFHKDHTPRKLTRIGLLDWSLEDTDFNPNGAAPANVTLAWENKSDGAAPWADITGVADPGISYGYDPIVDTIYYKVSATMADGLETLASPAESTEADLGHPSLRIKVTWDAVAGATQYTIYKGKGGLYGFIGYVDAADPRVFYDKNYAPSYDVVPVQEFGGFDPNDANQWPRVAQFYKQRMVYGATKTDSQKFWMSRPLYFEDLTGSQPVLATDAIVGKLVGEERHTIQHMVQLKKFVIFTDSAEWILGTSNNEAMAPDTVDPVIETKYGSDAFLTPLPIGDRILFVQNITRAVLDMGYDFATNAYKSDDLSRLARHLFEEKDIISWAYSLHPNSALWTVCSDGTMPCMTYVREHEIWGWSRMETEGEYTDVACVPEFDQHASYFQVIRVIDGVETICIERAEILYTNRVEDMFYVDCGLTYKNELAYTVGTRNAVDSFSFTKASHGLVTTDEVLLENEAFKTRCIVTGVVGDVVTVEPKYSDQPFPDVDTGLFLTGFFYECIDEIGGFDHLAGQTDLVALADGNVIRDISVDEFGIITLPYKAARVHCGFGYEGEIITLNLDPQQLVGRYLLKSVDSIKLRVENSRGILAGSSVPGSEITPLKSRSDEDNSEPNRLLNGIYEIEAPADWGLEAGVRILLPDPLPANILNVIPDMHYEG